MQGELLTLLPLQRRQVVACARALRLLRLRWIQRPTDSVGAQAGPVALQFITLLQTQQSIEHSSPNSEIIIPES